MIRNFVCNAENDFALDCDEVAYIGLIAGGVTVIFKGNPVPVIIGVPNAEASRELIRNVKEVMAKSK